MSGWVEVLLPQGERAIVRAGAVNGVILAHGLEPSEVADPDHPISLIMAGSGTLEGVHSISATRLIVHLEGAALLSKDKDALCYVAYRDEAVEFENRIETRIQETREARSRAAAYG